MQNVMFEVIKWPADMTTSRCPIHFTNELEVAVAPETIWSFLIDTTTWHRFYPSVEQVELRDGHERLQAGTRFYPPARRFTKPREKPLALRSFGGVIPRAEPQPD